MNKQNLDKDMIVKTKTFGICDKCMLKVDAQCVIRDGKVLMIKSCPEHGEGISIIENDASLYLALTHLSEDHDPAADNTTNTAILVENSSQKIFPERQRNLLISVEHRCDLTCFFCCAPNREKQNITLDKFKEVVNAYPGSEITLTGGEPMLRKDIFEMIKIVKAAGKKCVLTTNGIKLSDPLVVQNLKLADIDIVFLSIYSIDPAIEEKFCGAPALEHKLKALKNIKTAGIPLAISVALMPGANVNEFGRIFRLAVDNNANFISVRAIARVGKNVSQKEKLFLSDMIALVGSAMGHEPADMLRSRNKLRSSPYFLHCHTLTDKKTYLNEVWVPGSGSSLLKARIRLAKKIARVEGIQRGISSLLLPSRSLKIPLRIASWADVYDFDVSEMAYCKYEWLYDDEEVKNMFEAIILNEGL